MLGRQVGSVGHKRGGWAASAHTREKGGPADRSVTRAEEKRRWATRGKRKERVVGLGRKRDERERRGICFFFKHFFNFFKLLKLDFFQNTPRFSKHF
jgi:hypothetical protein